MVAAADCASKKCSSQLDGVQKKRRGCQRIQTRAAEGVFVVVCVLRFVFNCLLNFTFPLLLSLLEETENQEISHAEESRRVERDVG